MLKTIIALSFVLACGFLLVILSCALFNNFLPTLPTLLFLLSPVPNMVCGKIGSGAADYMDESSAAVDFGHWVTAFLVTSAPALCLVLAHVGLIRHAAAVMAVLGGGLVYGSIIVYGRFFTHSDEDF